MKCPYYQAGKKCYFTKINNPSCEGDLELIGDVYHCSINHCEIGSLSDLEELIEKNISGEFYKKRMKSLFARLKKEKTRWKL